MKSLKNDLKSYTVGSLHPTTNTCKNLSLVAEVIQLEIYLRQVLPSQSDRLPCGVPFLGGVRFIKGFDGLDPLPNNRNQLTLSYGTCRLI